MAAVLPVVPLTALPADAADWVVVAARARDARRRALGLRGARLAGVRGHAALAARHRRVPDRQRDAPSRAPRGADVALQRPDCAGGDRARRRARAEVLPLAGAALARRRPPDEGRARRGGARRRLPAPAPAVHRASATTSGCFATSATPSTGSRTRSTRCSSISARRRRSRGRRRSRPAPRCSRSPGGAGALASSSGRRSCSRRSSGDTSSPCSWCRWRSHGRASTRSGSCRSRSGSCPGRTTARRGRRLSAWPSAPRTVALAEREPLSASRSERAPIRPVTRPWPRV